LITIELFHGGSWVMSNIDPTLVLKHLATT
jgi:hypothetical protein